MHGASCGGGPYPRHGGGCIAWWCGWGTGSGGLEPVRQVRWERGAAGQAGAAARRKPIAAAVRWRLPRRVRWISVLEHDCRQQRLGHWWHAAAAAVAVGPVRWRRFRGAGCLACRVNLKGGVLDARVKALLPRGVPVDVSATLRSMLDQTKVHCGSARGAAACVSWLQFAGQTCRQFRLFRQWCFGNVYHQL